MVSIYDSSAYISRRRRHSRISNLGTKTMVKGV